jgi:hypothetical protein
METVTTIGFVIVLLICIFLVLRPTRIPANLRREDGLEIKKAVRTITRGVKPSDIIQIEYGPPEVHPGCSKCTQPKAKRNKRPSESA